MSTFFGGGSLSVDAATFTVGSGAVVDAAYLVDEIATGTVSEGATGVARMTADRKVIGSSHYADGSAVSAGSSYVSAMGAVVDDASTVQASEGSVGYCRMSVDRVLFVTGRMRDQEPAPTRPNLVMVGGVVRTTAATYGQGTAAIARFDTSGNMQVTLATKIAGEDQTNDKLKVEQQFSNFYISTATTTTVKSGSGFLHTITITEAVASTIVVYDNTAGSGTVIASFVASAGVQTYHFNVAFSTGLTIVTAGASKISGSYR